MGEATGRLRTHNARTPLVLPEGEGPKVQTPELLFLIQTPVQPPPSCVTLGKPLHLSVPFPHVSSGGWQ